MKKIFLSIIFILILNSIKSQDTVVLHHKYYTSTFIKSKHIPLLVEYTLTKEMLSCTKKIKRKNNFAPDPDLPEATNIDKDYKRSGYDRGHNMSAEDNTCNKEGMNECFYFSNMFPQIHSLNGGVWKKLENQERAEAKQYGKIKVFIGSTGELKKIGKDKVVVPEYCWKIIYIESLNTYECYIFPNKKPKKSDYTSYKVPLTEIEQKTNIKFDKDKSIIK
ncbi:MAG: DNA/RNA non-specific endonuclease [Bacteroidia bacterium]|nr:DNA/RNA non-specific endonuclease [Bacteroidia bacterium]